MTKKVCLIIGANSEIASSVIENLSSQYHLILCWNNNCDRIKKYFQLSNVDNIHINILHEEQFKILMEKLYHDYFHVDIIINCIGKNINSPNITEEIWDEVIGVNLKPAYFIGKYYWKLFFELENKRDVEGCIINISSTAGIRPIPNSPHYITAKAGLIALSEYFSKIMAPYVRVNVIAPGFVATVKHTDSKYNDIIQKIPLKRMATFEEIAQTVEYLIKCSYINAQTIVVDGGMIS